MATRARDIVGLPTDSDASGRSFDEREIALLCEVVTSGVLNATKGTKVKELTRRFAASLGLRFATACSSGTAAVHAAVAAIDPEPGDEIVTTPITDMGALTPILYQGAIPVFADVDASHGNVTAETIEPRLSERTRAIVVTHLFGRPCDMAPIQRLAARHGVPVLEDCAQAYLASNAGRLVGTFGAVACFSLQQGKHVTSGEGGLVVTDDELLERRARLFVDKAWGYGDPQPDHYFLALNYRMTELQGAVALAQLERLETFVDRRVAIAQQLDEGLATVDGITVPAVRPGDRHVYWRYPILVDADVVPGGPNALARALRGYDVASAPRYIQKPAFRCAVFADQRTFGSSRFPFTLARPEAVDYSPERYQGTFEWLERVLVLPLNERYGSSHVDYVVDSVRQAVAQVRGSR